MWLRNVSEISVSQVLRILLAVGLLSSPSFVSCARSAQDHPPAPPKTAREIPDEASAQTDGEAESEETAGAEDAAGENEKTEKPKSKSPRKTVSKRPAASGHPHPGVSGGKRGRVQSGVSSDEPGGGLVSSAQKSNADENTDSESAGNSGHPDGAAAESFSVLPNEGELKSGIRLVTVTPGNDITNAFGHVALEIDGNVYEWGGFNVNQIMSQAGRTGVEGALLLFLNGELPSRKVLNRSSRLEARYTRDPKVNRTIYYDEILLTPEQKEKLRALVESEFEEGNRQYTYNHFTNNCATKIRDLIASAVGGVEDELERQTDLSFQQVTIQSMEEAAASSRSSRKVTILPANMRNQARLLEMLYGLRADISGGDDFMAMLGSINEKLSSAGGETSAKFHEFLTVVFPQSPRTKKEIMFTPKRLREGLSQLVNPETGRAVINPSRTRSVRSTSTETKALAPGRGIRPGPLHPTF